MGFIDKVALSVNLESLFVSDTELFKPRTLQGKYGAPLSWHVRCSATQDKLLLVDPFRNISTPMCVFGDHLPGGIIVLDVCWMLL